MYYFPKFLFLFCLFRFQFPICRFRFRVGYDTCGTFVGEGESLLLSSLIKDCMKLSLAGISEFNKSRNDSLSMSFILMLDLCVVKDGTCLAL